MSYILRIALLIVLTVGTFVLGGTRVAAHDTTPRPLAKLMITPR